MRKIKSLACGMMAACVLITQQIPVQAQDLSAINLTDGMVDSTLDREEIFLEGENVTVISENVPSGRRVTVKHEDTGEEEYFEYNVLEDTLYSSVTGETTKYEKLDFADTQSTSSTSTEYISWASIRSSVGASATAVGIGAMIAAKCGVPYASIVSDIATLVGGGSYAIPDDPNHGIKLTIKTTKYYRTRMGRRQCYRKTHTVTGVSTY